MIVDPKHSPNSTSIDAQSPAEHQLMTKQLERWLFWFLGGFSLLILMGNGNPAELIIVLSLISINIFISIFYKGNRVGVRLFLSILATCIAGVLQTYAIDPSGILIGWFYMLTVYYTFALRTPHRYIFLVVLIGTLSLAHVANPTPNVTVELATRIGVIIALTGIMSAVRSTLNHNLAERNRLIKDLQQARDEFANQLEAHTKELQHEIQQHQQTESKLASERQLLQTVIDTIPSRLFVKDRSSKFTLVNQESLRRLGYEDDSDKVIGKSDFDIFPQFAERTYSNEQHLMESGESLIDWEETTADKDGVIRHYLISKVPMYDNDTGDVVGLVGVTTDVTSLKDTQQALEVSQKSLEVFLSQLKSLNEITLRLTRLETLDALVYQSIYQAMEHLGFSRLNCWFIDPQSPDQLVGEYFVDVSGNIVLTDNQVITLKQFPYAKAIIDGESLNTVLRDVPIYDLESNVIGHGDKAYTALLDGDKVIGCLYTDNLGNGQPFTDSHIEMLNLYGATLGALFNRQRAQETLRSREQESITFQQQLNTLNQVTLELQAYDDLDELCRQVVLLGRHRLGFERMGIWLIVDAQQNMQRGMWGTTPNGELRDEREFTLPIPQLDESISADEEAFVVNDIDIYDYKGDEQEKSFIRTGWRLVGLLADSEKHTGWLYADNAIWGGSLTQNQHKLFRLYTANVGVLINRQYARQALLASEQEARDFQQQLKNLNEVTVALESAGSLDELCRRAILFGRDKLSFERLGIWLTVQGEADKRRGMWGIDSTGNLRDERGVIMPVPDPESHMMLEDEVIVLQGLDVYDHNPLTDEQTFLRNGWLMIGFMADGTTQLGWLYADNALNGGTLTQNRQELFRLYSVTLGVLINRHYAQAALLESETEALNFQQQLKKLNEVSLELQSIDSLNELCRQAVILGRERLGFDRIGIWLAMRDELEMFRGTWGTDSQGQLRDERHLQIPMPVGHDELWDINEIAIIQNKASVEIDKELTNIGYVLNGVMQDEGEIIGWASIDNAIHDEPLTPNVLELFRLYTATMGVLIARLRVQEALQASEEEAVQFQTALKSLNEVRLELESTTSFDELCQQAVILGRERLGFDRIGIWMVADDDPNMSQGMWGTDLDGNVRDERALRYPIPDHQKNMHAEGEILVLQNTPSCEVDAESIDNGWAITGLMRDGNNRFGWISADNYLSSEPLTQNRYELFRLYAATMSLLCTRQKADDLLRQREIRYRAITEASSDIILIVNQDQVITYISPSVSRMLGVNPEIVVGTPISVVVHRDDFSEVLQIFDACLQMPQLRARVDEFRARHADGRWVKLEALVTSLIDDPVINGILISCRDITQRLLVEEGKRIVEQERERALMLRQFIGDISHDFLTPLSTIRTAAYLVKHGNKDDIDRRVTTIDQQIERLNKLIDNLKTIAKLDDMNEITMEKVDMNTILQSIPHHQNDSISKKQLSLQINLDDKLPTITGNTGLLRDAIYHIVDNAVQYTQEADEITIRSYQVENDIVVDIADTGAGISEHDLPFIFDRLYRADKSRNTNTGGSGLGLAIARRIIDLHHGTITIESQLDQGTQVTIKLPHIGSMMLR